MLPRFEFFSWYVCFSFDFAFLSSNSEPDPVTKGYRQGLKCHTYWQQAPPSNSCSPPLALVKEGAASSRAVDRQQATHPLPKYPEKT